MAVWLQVKVRGRGNLWPTGCTPALVCDTKAPLQLQLRLMAQYKCYIKVFVQRLDKWSCTWNKNRRTLLHLCLDIGSDFERLDGDRNPAVVDQRLSAIHCAKRSLAKASVQHNLISLQFPLVKCWPGVHKQTCLLLETSHLRVVTATANRLQHTNVSTHLFIIDTIP